MFENIMSNCPLLEILEIFSCSKIMNFKLTNLLKNLKQLKANLNSCQSIVVEAPNLELIDFTRETKPYIFAGRYVIDLRASQYANLRSMFLCHPAGLDDNYLVNFADKFPHIEHLSIRHCQTLQRINISSGSLKKIELLHNNGLKEAEFADKFPHIEHLSIQHCQNLQKINILSRSLKKIELLHNNGLKEAEFDVPSIAFFVYHGNGYNNKIMPKLSFTAASGGRGGWVSHIEVMIRASIYTSWFSKLKRFLISLNESEIDLVLDISTNAAFNVYEVNISDKFSRVPEVRELVVKANWFDLPWPSDRAFLDGIFGACH